MGQQIEPRLIYPDDAPVLVGCLFFYLSFAQIRGAVASKEAWVCLTKQERSPLLTCSATHRQQEVNRYVAA